MITVYGEALVDLVPVGKRALVPLEPALGGGPFNVARALGRMGSDVAFQSRLSSDNFGQALRSSLIDAHVDLSHCPTGEEPTSLAVASIGADGSASYQFYVEGTADRFADPVAVDKGFAVFGTLSLALQPAASRYAAVARACADAGVVVCLDPNIRPAFATEKHRTFLRDFLESVTVLKLSDSEVEFLGDTSHVPVVVTTSAAGLHVRAPFGECFEPSERMEGDDISDTIGAGDTVMAALAHQFDRLGGVNPDSADSADDSGFEGLSRDTLLALSESDWRSILRFAARAAAITISRPGADTPYARELYPETDIPANAPEPPPDFTFNFTLPD
ncbi:carbohydrate kinase family protein [Corynebacterium aquatimens]|uniref:Fructokinase n=1 Tax=Corynebacterium aquatimens TaxID=1190508 RepID=A0A931E5X3_9CORY|nr:carbohydrate kinase [Corynebacterium aquatimens]MBG6123003.1 fructokinase [Corynebacterium aquatimens]WJY66663.1 2-dehydro-3-deoxygluconokinase [Corynebacterium aquatimens]